MLRGRRDRLWMIGGAVGAVLLLAIGWFFFISPRNAQTSSLMERAAATDLRLVALRHRLADLRQQSRELPVYRARLARDRQALPTTSALSNFLRELQSAGDRAGVSVSGLLVGAPSQVGGAAAGPESKAATGTTAPAAPKLYALPMTLNATGSAASLDRFLDQLQLVQPRAVLIISASEAPVDQSGSFSMGGVNLTLTMQAFVAPPATTAKASPTATTSATATS